MARQSIQFEGALQDALQVAPCKIAVRGTSAVTVPVASAAPISAPHMVCAQVWASASVLSAHFDAAQPNNAQHAASQAPTAFASCSQAHDKHASGKPCVSS